MVGDQHLKTQRLSLRHTFDAGNAVVHGDQHVGARLLNSLGNGSCQAVTIHHAIGHDIGHMLCAQHAQTSHANSAGCGAITVVIGHDAEVFLTRNGICQQDGGFLGAPQTLRGQQFGQAIIQFIGAHNAPGGKQLRQQGVYARLR